MMMAVVGRHEPSPNPIDGDFTNGVGLFNLLFKRKNLQLAMSYFKQT